MAVLQTLYPTSDVDDGIWTPNGGSTLYSRLDESGGHDSDTTYVRLYIDSPDSTISDTFEVHITNPTVWHPEALKVRESSAWVDPIALSVRDSEAWNVVRSLSVRDSEAWTTIVPEVAVKTTARQTANDFSTFNGTVYLIHNTTVIQSTTLDVSSTSYVETSLTVPASSLIDITPNDLRVRIYGSVNLHVADLPAAIRVTQIKVELND